MRQSRREKLKAKNRIVIPKNLQLPEEMHDQIAKLAFLLLRRTSHSKKRKLDGYFFPFSSKLGKRFFGSAWPKVKDKAVEIGLMEVNENFEPGRFSQSVRLAKEYRTAKCRYVSLNRKLRKSSKEEKYSDPTTSHLMQHLENIDFSHVEAKKNKWAAIQLESVKLGLSYGVRCRYGRFHSSLSIMPKRIRLQARIRGQSDSEFVAIDVKNSQPLLLTLLIRRYIQQEEIRHIESNRRQEQEKRSREGESKRTSEPTTTQESKRRENSRNSRNSYQAQNSPHLVGGSVDSGGSADAQGEIDEAEEVNEVEEEIKRWLMLCETGEIYEEFCKGLKSRRLNRPVPKRLRGGTYKIRRECPSTWTRKNAKKALIVYLFNDLSANDESPIDLVMREEFPFVHQFLREIKNRNGYQSVACSLQQIESQIMIDGAAKAFLDRYPEVPIFTVHDELCVPSTHVAAAQEIILDCFTKCGLRPKLDLERASDAKIIATDKADVSENGDGQSLPAVQ